MMNLVNNVSHKGHDTSLLCSSVSLGGELELFADDSAEDDGSSAGPSCR